MCATQSVLPDGGGGGGHGGQRPAGPGGEGQQGGKYLSALLSCQPGEVVSLTWLLWTDLHQADEITTACTIGPVRGGGTVSLLMLKIMTKNGNP